jgi:Protein of unknown function (DUF3866)
MPLSLRRGSVTAIVERDERLVRLEVDGISCVAYPRLTGPVVVGDDVIVNAQARELELGSGGFDVLHVNLTRGLGLGPDPRAHVMKLPYTPLQHAFLHAEESGELAPELDGMPVVCCSLHSQVAPVCAGIGRGVRVAYVQIPGGALPLSLSDTVRALEARGLLEDTIAVGACIDGDVACVTLPSALSWGRGRGFDIAVCSIGPGIVGTGTRFGHGGITAAEAANAASALGGRALLAVRASSADPRARHRGVSHHARDVLELCLGNVTAAWPAHVPPPEGLHVELVDVAGWERECGDVPLAHMGRGAKEDPLFFESAFAAGRLARSLVD